MERLNMYGRDDMATLERIAAHEYDEDRRRRHDSKRDRRKRSWQRDRRRIRSQKSSYLDSNA